MEDSSLNLVEVHVTSGINPIVPSFYSVLSQWHNRSLQSVEVDNNTIIEQTKLAPRIAKNEVAKRLAEAIQLVIEVVEGRRSVRVGRGSIPYDVKGKRILKPRQKDIEIISQDRVYYPLWSMTLTYREQDFRRVVDATTGGTLIDVNFLCEDCQESASVLCYYCGAPLCHKHRRSCTNCGKGFCSRDGCGGKVGRLLKKSYCMTCIGQVKGL